MNNKRILELAAKAAGVRVFWGMDDIPLISLSKVWNPLTDDGEALRLAAAVGLSISPSGFDDEVDAWIDGEPEQNATASWEEHGGDKAAAWRMAITCAAAEIGKAMP